MRSRNCWNLKDKDMLVGDPSIFAIESSITRPYEKLSQRALGFFVIHITNNIFGVRSPEATMLACSLDSVRQRLSRRGRHCVSYGSEPTASAIVEAIRATTYDDDHPGTAYFGMSADEFRDVTTSGEIVWAPDGDEAFDDGAHVIQIDVGDKVRLIAFVNGGSKEETARTVVETWLGAEDYYNVLDQWQNSFEAEWRTTIADVKS